MALDREVVEHLRSESDHFLQAELGHDQRASWLLGLNSALLIAILAMFVASPTALRTVQLERAYMASAWMFGFSILACVYALWPMVGHKGSLLLPWTRVPTDTQSRDFASRSADDLILNHYWAHRSRAETKARRILVAMLLLLGALVSAASVLLLL